jgi:YidC/Oxa1 family membrane protein insertase
MDTKRLITAIILGLAFIVLYQTGMNFLGHRLGWDQPQPAQVTPSTLPSTAPSATQIATTTATAPAPESATASQPTISQAPATSEMAHFVAATQPAPNPIPSLLGSATPKDPRYAMQLDVEPLGAGLGSVLLNDFKRSDRKDPYIFETPLSPSRLDTEPLGSKSITVDGVSYDLAGVQWSRVGSDESQSGLTKATYAADLVRNGTVLLSLTKTYTVVPRTDPSLGWEIHVDFGFQNQTTTGQKVQLVFNGPTLPPPETNRPPDRQAVGGYAVDKETIDAQFHPIEEFKANKNDGDIDLTKSSNDHPIMWAGMVSNYFAAVVLLQPMQVGGTPDGNSYIAKVVAHGVNLDAKEMDQHQAYVTFQTTNLTLSPGKPVVLPLSVYLGPKWRNVLDERYYAAYPRHYDALPVIRGSMCGMSFCSFTWLSASMLWLLDVMHRVFRDWGLAIIGLVAIVRLLLHPVTKSSQISMAKMSKMGPEMQRLKEKYGDDKEGLNKAMVEFHREQGLGPYLGCLPMFLQMPIWFALYGVLQSTFELRQAPFLYGLTWIHDLAQPDTLLSFSHPVQILFFNLDGIHVLPVLLAAVMAIQARFMPKPGGQSPEQQQTQQMMQWITPVMFLFIFYSLPSGLNIYICTSTAAGVIESKIIRDHLKQREEAEKAGKVFVLTKPTRGSKQKDLGQAQKDDSPGLIGWIVDKWTKLQDMADEDRKRKGGDNDRKKKG